MTEKQHTTTILTRYLPRSYIHDLHSELRTTVAYRVWLKKLRKWGPISKDTPFSLLEVGCGAGYFLRFIERKYARCRSFGSDYDEQSARYAASRTERSLVICHDGHFLPWQNGSFDVVCSLQVIEHLAHPELLFREVQRVLKPGGLFLYSTPNPRGLAARTMKNKWRGLRQDHISLKTIAQWREIADMAGFQVLDDGSTALTGFNIMNFFPLALINWIPMALFGYFSWQLGGSYMAVARKMTNNTSSKDAVTT